jgi:hypothetical protein
MSRIMIIKIRALELPDGWEGDTTTWEAEKKIERIMLIFCF